LENSNKIDWLTLPNPFSMISKQVMHDPIVKEEMGTSEAIIGHVSGRRTDITRIIMNEQSAIFLVGTPNIGKSTLIRYLQNRPDNEWTWRDELAELKDQLNLEDIHFVQIDLTPIEGIEKPDELLASFVQQCIKALYYAYQPDHEPLPNRYDLRELRGLLRTIGRETPNTRYFLMLDSVERLGMLGMSSFPLKHSRPYTPQELGLEILDYCKAIRVLADLIDEFSIFGVIIANESLPRPKIDDQVYVSSDLARFTTIILQAFTWEDTARLLAQELENFGKNWATMFRVLGGNCIFSSSEQTWLRQQTGSHPYLLHQFCLHAFHFKQEYASIHGKWPELHEREKVQLSESINERLSTFLATLWQRIQESIDKSSNETKETFYEFVNMLGYKQADDEIDPTTWDELGAELRYILYSEGIVRYDRLRPIHFPGTILSRYLIRKANSAQNALPAPTTGKYLTISRPDEQSAVVSLSDLEYRLLKTLTQHPERCKEEELMKGAWGMLIERSRFTQRMHQLRRKLKEQGIGTDIIENSYGGFYSLNHPEWIHLA